MRSHLTQTQFRGEVGKRMYERGKWGGQSWAEEDRGWKTGEIKGEKEHPMEKISQSPAEGTS